MAITLCTFNVSNLFARYRFGDTFPGDLPHFNQAAFKRFNPTQRDRATQAITRAAG